MRIRVPLYIFFVLFIFADIKIMSQAKNNNELSYEEIEKKIDNLHDDSKKKWHYIKLYIEKSKKENNLEALLYAYRYASKFSESPQNSKYADSVLIVGNKSQNKKLLTDAYLNRGTIFMDEEKYQNALDDILKANKYANELGDDYNIYKTVYFIAQNKIYLGLYAEANKELEPCIEYFKKNAIKPSLLGKNFEMYYIYSLMSYIDSNTKLVKQKENQALLKEAFEFIDKNNLKIYQPYFISSEGTDAYYTHDYKTAIKKLSEAIRLYNDQWPHITEIYYLGLSNWKLGKHSVAVKYLEEIDKEYNKTKKLDPQFRSAYELLIKYNDSIGNSDKQLEYINKLMILDKSYEKNYKYLYTKINKEYDTQKLFQEKEKIENSLKTQRTIITILFLVALGFLLLIGYRYYHIQKIYKKRFEEIIAKNVESNITPNLALSDTESKILPSPNTENKVAITIPDNSSDIQYYNKITGLSPFIVKNILSQLEEFEREHKYLDNQVSKGLLSEILNTNATYLSRVINIYKGKNVSIYINDLRLDYLINLLQTDIEYLNMDVKELASICGFTGTQNFSDNFQRKFQIKPSYFIKMMKDKLEE